LSLSTILTVSEKSLLTLSAQETFSRGSHSEEADVNWVHAEECEQGITGEVLTRSDIAPFVDEWREELSDPAISCTLPTSPIWFQEPPDWGFRHISESLEPSCFEECI
jgi:hypothetical protein